MEIEELKKSIKRPKKALITGGMPYANGPLHLGHLAGALVPPDIYARWMRMLIGAENVLFVCGTDDHGSTSELAALKAGKPIREFIDTIHAQQKQTLDRFAIKVDVYTGTSRPECFPTHKRVSQEFLSKLLANTMLQPRVDRQWFDPKLGRFLQDRFVRGKCPNPKCENLEAYSDECDVCGSHFDPAELSQVRSTLSDATPELRDTKHWWLDMWKVADELRIWIQSKEKKWRRSVYNEVVQTVLPSLRFDNVHEELYKTLKASLPPHKSKYTSGKKVALTFESKAALAEGEQLLKQNGINPSIIDSWAHRAITRDVSWGIPMPEEFGKEAEGKTLYVWPDSLIAPISFTQVALEAKGQNPESYRDFWCDPEAQVSQFLGIDNVFFYVIMQGALWLGSQENIQRLPEAGEYQLTDVYANYHLLVDGDKMSKSKGNFYSGDQMLDEMGFDPDQIRYFLALLSLSDKSSNFDFAFFRERNAFLAGPLNAAFEKPISACHSKFDSCVPQGVLLEKVETETLQIIRRYLRSMEKAEYSTLLFALENYARQINSLFTQFKPHDDRQPEESRRNALYSCFYVLKNLMIMLYPFVPSTMDRLRESLLLDASVFSVDQLGTPIAPGHRIGAKQQYFPAVAETEASK